MAARHPKQQRKPFNDQPAQPQPNSRGANRGAWRPNGGTSFANAARQNTNFPPLGGNQNNHQQRQDYDPKLIASLASQIGNPIILNLKNGTRQEGIVVSTTSEGDSVGVTLKNVKDLSNPTSSAKDSHHFPAASCQGWHPPPQPNGVGHDAVVRTDTEISADANASRERELKQWQPDSATDTKVMTTDEAFGALGTYSGGSWDQFVANEQLFGVKTSFDEAAYTTKLDRSAPDFKERERKAQQIADEISRSATSNPHIAEERQMNEGPDDGIGEEDKYSAVVRGANAYVPPGARRNATSGTTTPSSQPTSGPAAPAVAARPAAEEIAKASEAAPPSPAPGTVTGNTSAPAKPADGLVGSFRDFVTNEKQRLTQRKQALAKSEMDKRKADLVKFSKTFKLNKPIPEDLIPILAKDEEKQKAILEKAKADAEASAKAPSTVGSSTAASSARPSVAKDTQGAAKPASAKPAAHASSTSGGEGPKKVKTSMYIQPIPPFDKYKVRTRAPASASGTPATINATTTGTPTSAGSSATPTPAATGAPVSPTSSYATSNANANNVGLRLNPNASAFRPNPTAPAFKPTSPAVPSPKVKDTKEVASPANTGGPNTSTANAVPPNPFFGTRIPPKKGAPVHLKDDFNPFRHAKVSEASAVSSMWQYSGKRFASMFPPIPPPQPHPPVMPGVVPGVAAPAAPPPYEEDPAVTQQAAIRQQQQQPPQHPQQPQYPIMYYPSQYPYAAPIQPHSQPSMIMQGQAPTFMPGPYMHPMQYPHHMQPAPGMYGAPPNMSGLPPGPHYMAPPGAYPPTSPPPPNGTPRGPPGAMTGAPMPPHGYYHPSPPMGHAVPYPMMMGPPPQQGPPHFDPSQGPPQQVPPMAGAGH